MFKFELLPTTHRLQDLKKIDEEPKPVVGRIGDKISLFEHQAVGGCKQTFQSTRSADVSPVRKATERLKNDFVLSDLRSRSAERYSTARSSSASPVREKPMTIKERARNFSKAFVTEEKAALPQKPAMTGMSQKYPSSVTVAGSKSPELDSQGKLDTKEQTETTAMSEITLKPDGQDTAAVGVKISIPKEQCIDSKVKHTETSKTADQGTKPNSVESDIPAKGTGDSAELTNNISPQAKGPSRTGSRSKRRKNRDPASPLSPNSENKPDHFTSKQEFTATKEQVDDKEETASASKHFTEKVLLPVDKVDGNTSDKQPVSNTKQQALKKEQVSGKQKKQLDSSSKKDNTDKLVNREEGSHEPSVNKDDTAACSRGTKKPIGKVPVIVPQKEEEAGGNSLSFIQERKNTSKDSREMSASSPSPSVERLIEKTPLVEQDPLVEIPKTDKELSKQSESKSKVKARQPSKKNTGQTWQQQNNEAKLINQTEAKDLEEKFKTAEREKTSQSENKDKEEPQQLLPSDKNTTKGKVLHSGQGISGTEGSVPRDDQKKNAGKEEAQPVSVITEPEANQPEPASQSPDKTVASSDLLTQTQHVTQMATTHPEKAAVCAVTQATEPETKSQRGPSKGEKATNASELQTTSTESPGTVAQPVVIAAEPQPNSASVEKTENSADDSQAHGANNAEISSSKLVTEGTTTVEEVTGKVANDTPELITAQTDNMAEKGSSIKEPTPISGSKSVSSEGTGQDDGNKRLVDKLVPSKVKISADKMKPAPSRPQCEESQNTASINCITSLQGVEKIAESAPGSTASSATVNVIKKTAEKTFDSPVTELSPADNGGISPHPQLCTVKPVDNKPKQTLKAPPSLKANKLIPDSIQHSSLKKLSLPRGLSRDDSATRQDTPSSWLDVDFPKQKLKVQKPKLSSSGSESNLLDTSGELDDDEFIEKIKKLCSPFSLPPRKHNHLRPPQPPFVMPAIKEDRFEKTFDLEEFKFGLRKNNNFVLDTPTKLFDKLQNSETKAGTRPVRASLADRSILLSSLDTHSRLKDKTPVKDEEDVKEEQDDHIKVKSRLEGSCVFTSLTTSSIRGKRNGVQTQAEGTKSGDVSPSEATLLSPPLLSQPQLPSPTATAPLKDTLSKQSLAPGDREKAQAVEAVEAVVSDSGPPLPSFNDIKLPDYLEKYLPREPAKSVQSIQGQEQAKTEVSFSVCYFHQLKK